MRAWSAERGQALVEMALVLIVLLTLIWVIVESARLMVAWVSVQQAARVGARFAAVNQWSLEKSERLDAIREATVQAARAVDLAPSDVGVYSSSSTIGDPNSPGMPGDRVRIEVIYNHELITPLFGGTSLTVRGREEACTEYAVSAIDPPCPPIPVGGP